MPTVWVENIANVWLPYTNIGIILFQSAITNSEACINNPHHMCQ